jgi:hypothetical protein
MNPEHCKTDFAVHVVNELVRFSFARPFAPARAATSPRSMTKSAASSRATGLTCYPSFRRKKNEAAMARKPEPRQPTTLTIYKVAAKQTRLGEVEAADEREAVEKGRGGIQAARKQANRCQAPLMGSPFGARCAALAGRPLVRRNTSLSIVQRHSLRVRLL